MAVIHNDNRAFMVLPTPATFAGQKEVVVSGALAFPPGESIDTRRLPLIQIEGRPPIDLELLGGDSARPSYQRDGDRLMVSFPLGTDRQPSPLLSYILTGTGSIVVRYWLEGGKVRDKKFSLENAPLAVRQAITDGAAKIGSEASFSFSSLGECPLGTWCAVGIGFADEGRLNAAAVRSARGTFGVLKINSPGDSAVAAILVISDPHFKAKSGSDLPEVLFDDEFVHVSAIPDAPSDESTKIFRITGDSLGQMLTSRILGARRSILVRLPTRGEVRFEETFALNGAGESLRTALGDSVVDRALAAGRGSESVPDSTPGAPDTDAENLEPPPVENAVSGRVTARKTGSAAGTTAFEWTVTLANTADVPSRVEVTLHYLDASGELLFKSDPLVAVVSPLKVEQIPGMSRLPDADATRVARVQAVVKPASSP